MNENQTEDQLEELDSAPDCHCDDTPAEDGWKPQVNFAPDNPNTPDGPDHEDGPEFEGFEGRTGDDGSEVDPFVSPDTASDTAGEMSTDEDGYLDPNTLPDKEEGTVAIQDYDPANPDAELAEPTKILRHNDRRSRKNEQNNVLDRTSIPASQAKAPCAEGEAGAYGDEHSDAVD